MEHNSAVLGIYSPGLLCSEPDFTSVALYSAISHSSLSPVHAPSLMGNEFRSCWVVEGTGGACIIRGGGREFAEVSSVAGLIIIDKYSAQLFQES